MELPAFTRRFCAPVHMNEKMNSYVLLKDVMYTNQKKNNLTSTLIGPYVTK